MADSDFQGLSNSLTSSTLDATDLFAVQDISGADETKKIAASELAGAMALLGVISINAISSAGYTLVLGDAGKLVTLSHASAQNLTVPTNASVAFPVGTAILLQSIGAGQWTVVASGGVTVSATPGLKLRTQYSRAALIKTATNTWLLAGDLAT